MALTELDVQQDWAALVPVLCRLICDDTDTDLDHLDPTDPAIATALRRKILSTRRKE
ncbi:MAG: hypothetical protein L0H96_10580 [Humibacillus sp.]|nr:hypothetical protein [Humibacillus sp.]MDN5777345.1 hypothetical protein [Humibacillus sp.]